MEIYESSNVRSAWDDQLEADAWMKKVLELEKQYQEELTAAGDDPEKKNAVIRLIAEEAGMPPRLVTGMMNPMVSQIVQYYRHHKANEPAPAHTSAGPWICKMCGAENDGIFCPTCGAKRP